jgi:glycosyltransferase involved in cell wall biosynthesis
MGGVEKAFLEISRCLLKTGRYEITIWCKTKITDKYFLDFFKNNEIKIHDHFYDKPKSNSIVKNITRFFLRFLNRYKNNKLFFKALGESDVIIDFKNGCMQNRLRKIKNKLKIVWLHCSFKVITKDIKTDCSVYDKIICPSETLLSQMIQTCPNLKARFERIYLPFDIERIRELGKRTDNFSKKEISLLEDDYFLVVTRLSKDKDLDTVVLAYEQFLYETSSKIKLYFIGDGPERKRLEKLVKDNKLSEMILFLGQKNEPYSFIKNSRASILSSKEEGGPLIIIESMILKTIVISSDCPIAPREILNNAKCGVLFETGNSEELKNIMIKIDSNKIIKEHFSKNINKWIDKFDKKNIMKQIEAIIKQSK